MPLLSEDELVDVIIDLTSAFVGHCNVTEETDLQEINIDSLDSIEMLLGISDKLGVDLVDFPLEQMTTPRKMAADLITFAEGGRCDG